jgi:hypothetical protein
MNINQQKMVLVDVKVISICCKVTDRFTYQLKDTEGNIIFDQDDGYVPDFMPGDHYGDYLMLDIDLNTGMVLNWKKNTAQMAEDIERVVNKKDE